MLMCNLKCGTIGGRKLESRGRNVLAYQEDVNLAEVELIVEGESGKTIICRVHTSVKLEIMSATDLVGAYAVTRRHYHDCLALVLDDVTRPTNFISSS
jgi:hypothetical protein